MNPNDLFQVSVAVIGSTVPVGMFVWNRYQALEKRLDRLDRQSLELKHSIEISRQAQQSNVDRLELAFNGNKEAIQHARERFFGELETIKKDLSGKIGQIQNWLDANTEFKSRD